MNLKITFSRIIILKNLLLLLIIAWGASVQITNSDNQSVTASTDIGGIVFFVFSVLYFVNSYLLYKYRYFGKILFVPLVSTFIILGFLTELFNPSQFSKDIFYLFIFYIISPTFFIAQGAIISIIYFTDIKHDFR